MGVCENKNNITKPEKETGNIKSSEWIKINESIKGIETNKSKRRINECLLGPSPLEKRYRK